MSYLYSLKNMLVCIQVITVKKGLAFLICFILLIQLLGCSSKKEKKGLNTPKSEEKTKAKKKEDLKLNYTNITLYIGNTSHLKVNTSSSITWTSLNKKIASVKNGLVTGISEGKTNIQAKMSDKTLICHVTVKAKNTVSKKETTEKNKKKTINPEPQKKESEEKPKLFTVEKTEDKYNIKSEDKSMYRLFYITKQDEKRHLVAQFDNTIPVVIVDEIITSMTINQWIKENKDEIIKIYGEGSFSIVKPE